MFEDSILYLRDATPGLAILATLVLVLIIGTFAQIIADRMRIPATGPLLLAGFLFGPAILGLIQPDVLGPGFRVVVRAAVAICIFEGGLMLDVGSIRQITRAVAGLVTVGLLITTGLSGTLAHFLLGWPWGLALLFGAIVSVTGPTVITPILEKVRVHERVRTTLQSESIIADPLGVILAALIFTAILEPGGWRDALPVAARTFGTGLFAGVSTGAAVWIAARHLRLLPAKFIRLVALAAAVTAYTLAELIAHEAGVLAAAVAGITFGSINIPHKEQVEQFKGDLASMAISAVFILLAASLDLRTVAQLGWRGALIVLLIMLVVRPIRVFASTVGSELRTNEKAFISSLGPRGVVAGSVATFFSLELIDFGYYERSHELVALVFAVILATVLIQGSAAGRLARLFHVMPQHTLIVGADEASLLVARHLSAAGESVTVIDVDDAAIATAKDVPGVRAIKGDATDFQVLRRGGADDAKCLIAMTSSDKVNLLVSTLARTAFPIPRIIAKVGNSQNEAAFTAAGIEIINPARASALIVENMILRPSFLQLVTMEDRGEQLAELQVTSREVIGKTLAALALQGAVVVALRRKNQILVPTGKTRLRSGDQVTLMGTAAGIDAARLKITDTEDISRGAGESPTDRRPTSP